MSGIAGILNLDGAPADEATLDAMKAASAPFIGAEGVGIWRAGPLAMLRFHAATSITEGRTTAGWQPLSRQPAALTSDAVRAPASAHRREPDQDARSGPHTHRPPSGDG